MYHYIDLMMQRNKAILHLEIPIKLPHTCTIDQFLQRGYHTKVYNGFQNSVNKISNILLCIKLASRSYKVRIPF